MTEINRSGKVRSAASWAAPPMDSAQVTHLLAVSEPNPLTVLAAELTRQLGGLVDDCADIRQTADEVHPRV